MIILIKNDVVIDDNIDKNDVVIGDNIDMRMMMLLMIM